MKPTYSPWLNGVPQAAEYACLRESEMRRLVKSGAIESRLKPKDKDGKRPRGVLVYAPSIDKYLLSQPSGASSISQALQSA